jgi:hypothetical protein
MISRGAAHESFTLTFPLQFNEEVVRRCSGALPVLDAAF